MLRFVNDFSHLIIVPAGVLPTEALSSSAIVDSGGMGGVSMGGGGVGGFEEYGVDPSVDPELAAVLRASMEEARAQEEQRVRK